MTLSVQWLTIATMLLSGLGMGALFDGYRVVSWELKLPRWWLPVLDVLYWMLAATLVFRVLYASNNGEVRAYVFIGLALGVILYYSLLSKLVIGLVRWLIRAVRACIAFLVKLFHILVVKPILFMYKLLRIILGFGTALTIFLLKIVLQLVRPIWLLLLWVLRPLLRPLGRWLQPYWERSGIPRWIGKAVSAAADWWNKRVRRKQS